MGGCASKQATSAEEPSRGKPVEKESVVEESAPVASAKIRPIVVLNGQSGCGKSTLLKLLFGDFESDFGFSVSHTTRPPREGEEDGVDYHFVTKEKFEEGMAAGDFIETATVHGNYYGTSFRAVNDVVDSGRICMLDIDVQGSESLKKSTLNEKSRFFFIQAPSLDELEKRLRGRGSESEETLQTRLETARKEFEFFEKAAGEGFYDEIVMNDEVEKAYTRLRMALGGKFAVNKE